MHLVAVVRRVGSVWRPENKPLHALQTHLQHPAGVVAQVAVGEHVDRDWPELQRLWPNPEVVRAINHSPR